MTEKVTLTRTGLALVFVVLVAGALGTALPLYFLGEVNLPLVMLVTCLSPAALIILLYIGYLVRTDPEKRGYIVPLRIIGVASICMGLLVFLDFGLPTRTIKTNVQGKYPRGDQNIAHMGDYEQAVSRDFYDRLMDGTAVDLEVTPFFNRMVTITAVKRLNPDFTRSTGDVVFMAVAGLLFLFPVALFRFSPRARNASRDLAGYLLVVVPSYIISLIACGLWVKFLLVHVLHVIDKM